MLVNQPTVRDRSVPSPPADSSRPWPSTSTSTAESRDGTPRRLRHSDTASARPASRTSFTRPWNAAGTAVSSADVAASSSSRVRFPAVPRVSSARSSGRFPSSGSSVRSVSVHRSSSAARRPVRASSASRPAHPRKDVPTGSSRTGAPVEHAAQAVTRSGSRIRHDTPSTTRWCRTTRRRPRAPAPASSQTSRTIVPAAGSNCSRAMAACSAAVSAMAASPAPATSTRWTHAAASTVPGGAMRGSPSAGRLMRSAS
ncbi:hypothetical protein BJF79_43550 [Actinomadura sp. CNU-125]|nr:hypothetical protein BJF79_43550 [Actinomadura sp. CNU-125]